MPKYLSAGVRCSNATPDTSHGYAHAFITKGGKPELNLCDSCFEAWSATHDYEEE